MASSDGASEASPGAWRDSCSVHSEDSSLPKIAESPVDAPAAERLCEKTISESMGNRRNSLEMDEHGNFQKMIRDSMNEFPGCPIFGSTQISMGLFAFPYYDVLFSWHPVTWPPGAFMALH